MNIQSASPVVLRSAGGLIFKVNRVRTCSGSVIFPKRASPKRRDGEGGSHAGSALRFRNDVGSGLNPVLWEVVWPGKPSKTHPAAFCRHHIQSPDSMDPFSGSANSIRPTRSQPLPTPLRFPFSEAQSCRYFNPNPISLSSLAIKVKDRECKWPDMVFPAPLLIMLLQINHEQFRIPLLDQAVSDKRIWIVGPQQEVNGPGIGLHQVPSLTPIPNPFTLPPP